MKIQRCNTTPQANPNFGLNLKQINGIEHIATTQKKQGAYISKFTKILSDLGCDADVKLDISLQKNNDIRVTLQGLGKFFSDRCSTGVAYTSEVSLSKRAAICSSKLEEIGKNIITKIGDKQNKPPRSYSSSEA